MIRKFLTKIKNQKIISQYLKEHKKIKLNLGCGLDIRKDCLNIDLYNCRENGVVRMDIENLDLPDNFADEILSFASLEHFSHTKTNSILKEWHRVLKIGGKLILVMDN